MKTKTTKEIHTHKNNCAILAFHELCDLDENILLEFVKKRGFDKDGFPTHLIGKTLEELKVKYKKHISFQTSSASSTLSRKYTIKEFKKKFNKGLFFVSTQNHVFLIADGIEINPNFDHHQKKAKIWFSFEITETENDITHFTKIPLELNHFVEMRMDIYVLTRNNRSKYFKHLFEMRSLIGMNLSILDMIKYTKGKIRFKHFKKLYDDGIIMLRKN